MRILLTGGRDWPYRLTVVQALLHVSAFAWDGETVTVAHGDAARGADRYGAEFCQDRPGWVAEPVPADWEGPCDTGCRPGHRKRNRDGREYCPAAGTRRNLVLVARGADVCAALATRWDSGTGHCARAAREAGIPVIDYGVDTRTRQATAQLTLDVPARAK